MAFFAERKMEFKNVAQAEQQKDEELSLVLPEENTKRKKKSKIIHSTNLPLC